MPKVWRKALEQGLEKKDVELLNVISEEAEFSDEDIEKFAEKLDVSEKEVKKRIKNLEDKDILLKERISIVDPMKLWDGYYLVFIKVHLVPPIISEKVDFPTGWDVGRYIERFREKEKDLGVTIVRQAYCLQGTEYDLGLIVSAPSQEDFARFSDKLCEEGWIEKIMSYIPVEFGDEWIFDPVEVPSVEMFEERVEKVK